MERVAVIGAGPAGLVAARWLASEGFTPVVFDQAGRLGGQWRGEAAHSGIWPGMRTNTSRVLTAFSDLAHEPDAPTYPASEQILAYLARYAEQADLLGALRLDTRVADVRRDGTRGWTLTTPRGDERFPRVVVASGRFQRPWLPDVPGLAAFGGSGGVRHTSQYEDPDAYRGLRVLVAGGAISALEIAAEIATRGAARVVVTQRRQRYVLPKLAAGVPTDHLVFTRYHALALDALPAARATGVLEALVLGLGGNPAQYGAPAPPGGLAAAGVTLSQHYLPLVAEGRIVPRPWMTAVEGDAVTFADGATEAFDAVLCGTGFVLGLPFLAPDVRAALDVEGHHVDLHRHTFHPALPGLACAGLIDAAGPYFPVLEQQARWIAYTWSGAVQAPDEDELRAGVATCRARRGGPHKTRMDVEAVAFARAAGVLADPRATPDLARALLFGPLGPASFRLAGRDALPDAAARVRADAAAFGCQTDATFTAGEVRALDELLAAGADPALVGRPPP